MGLLDILASIPQAITEKSRADAFGTDWKQRLQAYQDKHQAAQTENAINNQTLQERTDTKAAKDRAYAELGGEPAYLAHQMKGVQDIQDTKLAGDTQDIRLRGNEDVRAQAAQAIREAKAKQEASDWEVSHPLLGAGLQAKIDAERAAAGLAGAHTGLVRQQTKDLADQSMVTNGAVASASNPPEATPAVQGAPGKSQYNEQVLVGLDPRIAATVKGYAEGRMPVPAGFALKSPYFQNLMKLVNQYDPTFDAALYSQRVAARRDFLGGGKSAASINAMNTVIGHLGELSSDAGKLGNTAYPLLNKIKNFATEQTGGAAPTNFMTRAHGVATEMMRVYRQTGAGSVSEIDNWFKSLDPSMSPAQQSGAFSVAAQMLEDKLASLQSQAEQGLGAQASQVQTIRPDSRATLDRLQGGPENGISDLPTVPAASTRQQFKNPQTGELAWFTKRNGQWQQE